MAVIDSLLVALGYEFNGKDAEKFATANKAISKTLKTVAAAAVAATSAIGAMAIKSADSVNETAKLARNANLAVDEFDALSFAAGQTQISGDALSSSLEQLSIRASEAARGTGSAVEAFGLLGVEVTDANGKLKTTDQLLLESADALNSLSDKGQRLELADKLGLKDINLLLLEGSNGISKLTAEAKTLGVVTAEDAKAAEEFIDEWSRFKRVVTTIARTVATKLLPVFTGVIENVRSFINDSKELMSSGLVTWFFNLTNVLQIIKTLFIGIAALKVVQSVLMLTKAIRALGTAGLIANAKVLLIPLAIGAAVAALGLLIEDVITFFTGGESLTGRIVDSIIEKFDVLKEAVNKVKEFFSEAIDSISNLFSQIPDFISKAPDFFSQVPDFVSSLFDGSDVSANINGIVDDVAQTPVVAAMREDKASSAGIDPATGAPVNNSTSTSKTVSIREVNLNIDGGNPEDVKKAVQEVLDGNIRQATASLESAVEN